MGYENAKHISQLVPTNPTPADPKSMGDDHLRSVKTSLLSDLNGFAGAILVTGACGGVANAYTVTPPTPMDAYAAGTIVIFTVAQENTGASALNVSNLGPRSIMRSSGELTRAGDLVLGVIYVAIDSGAEYRLTAPTQNELNQLSFESSLPALSKGFLRSDGAVATFSTSHSGYAQNEVLGAPIASAAMLDLSMATGNLVHVTGTTNVTAITIPVGAARTLIFDGELTLTHGAGLLLPGAASIVTRPGDRMDVRGDTGGAVVIDYVRADGIPATATGVLHVRDQRAGGGGGAVSGWQTRVLNTVVTNTIPGASLAANQVTLPPGTYDFFITAPALTISGHRARLVGPGMVRYGTTEQTSNDSLIQTRSIVVGRLTITTTREFSVEHYTAAASTSAVALGITLSDGSNISVHTEAIFTKVA